MIKAISYLIFTAVLTIANLYFVLMFAKSSADLTTMDAVPVEDRVTETLHKAAEGKTAFLTLTIISTIAISVITSRMRIMSFFTDNQMSITKLLVLAVIVFIANFGYKKATDEVMDIKGLVKSEILSYSKMIIFNIIIIFVGFTVNIYAALVITIYQIAYAKELGINKNYIVKRR